MPDGALGANCPATGRNGTNAHGRRAQAGAAQFTNLHFHGLHVTPRERSPYGNNVLVELPNGKSRFRVRIPPDHDQGTFWYHAHLHTCTDDKVSAAWPACCWSATRAATCLGGSAGSGPARWP